jgi:hypothetical protein
MASAIRQMTSVGGDIRKIARLLQKKAPPGHMLAYINQEEADLLKARGGSGEPHADTGVPSFEEEYVPDYSPTGGGDQPSVYQRYESPQTSTYGSGETTSFPLNEQQQNYEALRSRIQKGSYMPSGSFTPAPQSRNVAPLDLTSGQTAAAPAAVAPSVSYGDFAAAPSGSRYTDESISGSLRDSAARVAAVPAYVEPTQDKDLLGRTQDYFSNLSPETKKLLGQTAVGSIPALIGAYTTQQASEQARKAKEEMMARSAPYKAQADEMITKARSGELTPVGQQQLQAVQAQAAQAAQGRGGVAAQQAMTQVEAYRQQLLQGQYDYGLKLANISDQIALGAIKTGLEADRYINAATMDYFNNAIRMFQDQSPQVAGRQPTDTTAPRG